MYLIPLLQQELIYLLAYLHYLEIRLSCSSVINRWFYLHSILHNKLLISVNKLLANTCPRAWTLFSESWIIQVACQKHLTTARQLVRSFQWL